MELEPEPEISKMAAPATLVFKNLAPDPHSDCGSGATGQLNMDPSLASFVITKMK